MYSVIIDVCICILLYTGVPDKIKGSKRLEFDAINLTAVILSWSQPFDSNSPITSYIVSCNECHTPSNMTIVNVTNVVINGLTPGVEYLFSVLAVNDIGKGPDSNSVKIQSATPGIKLMMCFINIHEYLP